MNDRLRERAQKVSKKEDKGTHMLAQVYVCGGEATFSETTILGTSSNTSRLSLEAFLIKNDRLLYR